MSVELNRQYGRLFTICRLPTTAGRAWWLCNCSCGSSLLRIRGDQLVNGTTRSCGCLRRALRNGLSNSPTYKTWAAMRRRCNDPSHPRYADYGGRGIKVCPAWNDRATGLDQFIRDVGIRPLGLTLDRRDVDGNYEPGNVRWATLQEQRWNRRDFSKRAVIEDRAEQAHWDQQEQDLIATACDDFFFAEAGGEIPGDGRLFT